MKTGEFSSMVEAMGKGANYSTEQIVWTVADEYMEGVDPSGWEQEGSCSDEDRRLIAELLDQAGLRNTLVDAVCKTIIDQVRSNYLDSLWVSLDRLTPPSDHKHWDWRSYRDSAVRVVDRHKALPEDHWLRVAAKSIVSRLD